MSKEIRHYPWIMIFLHWTTFVSVVSLFGLGVWMVDLDYYHAWYKTGPDIHRSIGLILMFLVAIRLVVRWLVKLPASLAGQKQWELMAAKIVHFVLYLMLFACCLAGYLISTADGRGIVVFDLIEIPALISGYENQEDIAGEVHWYLALFLLALAAGHAAVALKHHFVNRDLTLVRMLGFTARSIQKE